MAKGLKVSLTLIAALATAFAALLSLLDANTQKRNRYLIPEGYRGWLCTTYLAESKFPLPIEDGFRLVKFDQSGVVQTSSEGLAGKLKDEFIVYSGTNRRPLNIESEMGGGFTTAPVTTPDHFTFMFWVSPNAKTEQPPYSRDKPYECGPSTLR